MKELLSAILKYEGIIYRVCRYYTSTEEDCQDLFQDIVLEICKSYPNFRKESKISTWMHSIASNTAIRNLKKNKRRPDVCVLSEDFLELEDDIHESELENRLKHMHKAISKLEVSDKTIAAELIKGASVDTISTTMNITPNNARVRMHRVRKRIRRALLAG